MPLNSTLKKRGNMPKRNDIHSIMIIGAGPIIIGQACEFDYSGTQACKALREEGYKVILVNSNPATIMTDPETADVTYIEPLTVDTVKKILKKERPDALLATMGGQTALNISLNLQKMGVLKQLKIEMIGINSKAINTAEDRERFKLAMEKIGLDTARSRQVGSLKEALESLSYVGLPAVIRPSFTLGGTGGGAAYNKEEFQKIVTRGLAASPVNTVLIEESLLGWKEYEMEVVRDRNDNCIIVCSIENIDPMGVHTGDSVTVAPALTLTDKEYQKMRSASLAILREIGVETGGSNVQFAINPENGNMIVIEMNPRVSRSSALASKATGFPIAKIAAKLAVGYTLDELANDITKTTPASFEPTLDYVVTKVPRFTFEKFPGTAIALTTSMKSVGEGMAIGATFAESLQKALRSMETGLNGLDEVVLSGAVGADGKVDKEMIKSLLRPRTPGIILKIAQALRHGLCVDDIFATTRIDPWFIEQIRLLIDAENHVKQHGLPRDADAMYALKQQGFSDERLAVLSGMRAHSVKRHRLNLDVVPAYRRVDTCAGEFPSSTPYLYSCYERQDREIEKEAPTRNKKVIIIGGGPNRIGQGIEFDYCCVHASYALRKQGFESIVINCNPETVSTDYDTSDRLYFDPLTGEDVLSIIRKEQKIGDVLGVVVQFGGQTALTLSKILQQENVPILGTLPDAIDLAEDRKRFQSLLTALNLHQPPNGIAITVTEAIEVANKIGYPAVLRPSYVLGGRAMEIVADEASLRHYMQEAVTLSNKAPILLDKYLQGATEVDVDALCDGQDVHVVGIMEHIEEAGIHSGDSACCLPPYTLSNAIVEEMRRQVAVLARALKVIGLINVQFAVQNGDIYILEANPRASRTVPFVAKATDISIVNIATLIMLGKKLRAFPELKKCVKNVVAVKESVFPFGRFPGAAIALGPEMRSTGEVLGLDRHFSAAFLKSQLGVGMILPKEGTVFISVRDEDKKRCFPLVKKMLELGFSVIGTRKTAQYLTRKGLTVGHINKVYEGQPHIVDMMADGKVDIMFNTTSSIASIKDGFLLRKTALAHKIPYYTTINGAFAAADAICWQKRKAVTVSSLQEYFK